MHLSVEDTHVRLNTGVLMPKIGFGTWMLGNGREAYDATSGAIDAGYRLIDTAAIYGNEESVGRAVREAGIPREEIMLTTKLWKTDFGIARAKAACENSLNRLGFDYIDLYLIHWPGDDRQARQDAWRAMESLYREGMVHNIGVSNFSANDLKDLHETAHLVPAVNQIELHPFNYKQQRDILRYCQENGIIVEAYSPLSRSEKLGDRKVTDIADKYEKSPAQILLRWSIQHGAVPIPKSTNPEHMKSNLEIFDFELSEEDMVTLNHLSEDFSVLG